MIFKAPEMHKSSVKQKLFIKSKMLNFKNLYVRKYYIVPNKLKQMDKSLRVEVIIWIQQQNNNKINREIPLVGFGEEKCTQTLLLSYKNREVISE